MSSELLSALELIQMNNYASIAVIAAVLYDYLLTFSREIDYVWRRPWTWVSTVFALVRFVGLSWAIINALSGTTFIPGPYITYVCKLEILDGFDNACIVIWEYPIFLAAADLVLYVLLFTYVPQMIAGVVFTGIYYDPRTNFSVTVIQVAGISFCNYSNDPPPVIVWCVQLPRFLLATALLGLAVTQTLKQSVNMYKATNQWQPNRYMQLFARDGIIYFVATLPLIILSLIAHNTTISSTAILFLDSLSSAAVCVMMPRFIIDVRELYDRDLRGRWQGIDTGFGGLSQPIASQDAAMSEIEFGDVFRPQGPTMEGEVDDSDGIQLKERRGGNVSLENGEHWRGYFEEK